MKQAVHDFWNAASCGETLYLQDGDYDRQAQERYRLEPYIHPFANFSASRGKRVLEVGVGLGADHEEFAKAGAILSGIDLTARAVEHTRQRLARLGLQSDLRVADAEHLPFEPATFDLIYSWGVLHHSPGTGSAVEEVWKALKPGGVAKVMLYNKWSVVGLMLWLRYGLIRLRSLKWVYANYLESPGTKAYTKEEVGRMFGGFDEVKIEIVLTHADLLTSRAGERHGLMFVRRFWPRKLISRFPNLGLAMLISAKKAPLVAK